MRRLTFERSRCLACRSCEIACALAHSGHETIASALGKTPAPRRRIDIRKEAGGGLQAVRCEQCDEPLCVFACKSGALSRDPESGATRFDEDRCVGCAMCLMVCPFGLRLDSERGRVVRCDACAGRDTPACVAACPTHALGAEDGLHARPTSDFTGRVVVVGSSAAGIAACEAARESAPGCRITLVTADDPAEYSRPLLPYALSGRVARPFIDWRAAGYLEKSLGVEVLRGARAMTVRTQRRLVELAGGRDLAYDRLVICTGARGQRLRVSGADLPGVFTLRDLQDLAGILEFGRPGRSAVVVGGGNVGIQAGEALHERGLRVTVAFRSSHVLSQMVDAEAGSRVGALLSDHGLALRPGRDPVEILGRDRVTAVRLDDGECIEADLVVVGKGIVPNVEWLAGSGIAMARGIVVDRSGRTNIPSVFAAGDCAETTNPLTGASSISGIWPVAYEMGRAAGSAAVGIERPSAGALRLNASTFFGHAIVSIGEVCEDRLPDARAKVLDSSADVYRKLVVQKDRLVGALLYGDIARAGEYYRMYREGTTQPFGPE
jgi:NAD(P)H-nitrite reductase large subunit/Fe-S-cluster-containing hydrogenase component 2